MRLRTAIATATTAAVLATSGVALTGATTNSGSRPSTTPATVTSAVGTSVRHPLAGRAARVRLRIRIRRGAAAVITKTIGIDRKTLRADLAGGQTIAQIATAKGVAPQTVIDALVTAATDKLTAAVTAHEITAARATKIEQKLPARAAKLVNTWHPKHAKTTAA